MRYFIFLFMLLLTQVVFPKPAYAYLDPGTGSYFFQILLGALLGAGYMIKMFWHNIVHFFRNVFKKNKDSKKNGS